MIIGAHLSIGRGYPAAAKQAGRLRAERVSVFYPQRPRRVSTLIAGRRDRKI